MKGETEFESLLTALRHYGAPERKIEIVNILWVNNKELILRFQWYKDNGYTWKQAYRKIQKEDVWKRSRLLNFEYYQGWVSLFEWDGTNIVKCRHCNTVLKKHFTMHHSSYEEGDLLNPLYIEIIDAGCHARHHRGVH